MGLDNFIVPFEITNSVKNEKGIVENSMKIEMVDAPAPTSKFIADRFGLIKGIDEWRIVFAQSRIGNLGYRAMIDVHIPTVPLEHIAASFKTLLLAGESVPTTSFEEEPSETVALFANFGRVAHNEFGACVDFFLAPAFSFTKTEESKQGLKMEAVVRVLMSEPVFRGFAKNLLSLGLKGLAND